MLRGAALLLLAAAPSLTRAADWIQLPDWEADLDVRLVDSNGRETFFNGGLGTLRFDEGQSGIRLGRARLALSQAIGDVWSVKLDASAWGDADKSPVGITEAYLQFRPYPLAGYRFRVKAGAFYAPISLENRAAGWESPYSLSYSAINSWLAEELRTIGVEGQMDWLGTRLGHSFDLATTAGAFGWNDPAGAVLATRGFELDDRQTTLFGRTGSFNSQPYLYPLELFRNIDGHAGYYVGVEGRYLDRVVLRALHYDNRSDPTAYDPAIREYAWETRFNAVGLRAESESGWTAIAQWLGGETQIYPDDLGLDWPFKARFALLSKQLGEHRLSVRFDSFAVNAESTILGGSQSGHAWTAAYFFEPGVHWRLALEWLQVSSNSINRVLELGQPAFAKETQVQFSVRYALGSLAR
jgi:hypothetical protein